MDTRKDVIMTDVNDEEALSPSLLDLPQEIIEKVLLGSSKEAISAVALASWRGAEAAFDTKMLFALLTRIVNAQHDPKSPDVTSLESIAILKKYPHLLFRTGKITDSLGRKIEVSPYQLLLCMYDPWALRQVHKEILPLIENGEALAKEAFYKQFPDYKTYKAGMYKDTWPPPVDMPEEALYDERNRRQVAEIVEQLAIVKQLIDADPFTNSEPLDTTKRTVETLCKLFQPALSEVIKSGLLFPLAIMKEIYKTYNALQGHFSYFSLAVIKPAMDASSAVDQECYRDGLRDLNMEKGPSRRCHPAYQHPLSQPLNLTLVSDKRRARLVDLYDGEVLFDSSAYPGYFDGYNKSGAWPSSCVLSGGLALWRLENLWRTKAASYGSYYAATPREIKTPSR